MANPPVQIIKIDKNIILCRVQRIHGTIIKIFSIKKEPSNIKEQNSATNPKKCCAVIREREVLIIHLKHKL